MTDRDELLRQIGARVVERAKAYALGDLCPCCGNAAFGPSHTDDCPLVEYLRREDEAEAQRKQREREERQW